MTKIYFFLKITQVIIVTLNIYKNIPYTFKFLANIPVSLKPLPGPQLYLAALADTSFQQPRIPGKNHTR